MQFVKSCKDWPDWQDWPVWPYWLDPPRWPDSLGRPDPPGWPDRPSRLTRPSRLSKPSRESRLTRPSRAFRLTRLTERGSGRTVKREKLTISSFDQWARQSVTIIISARDASASENIGQLRIMKNVFFAGSKLGKYKNGTILRSCEKDEDKWAQCCPCTVRLWLWLWLCTHARWWLAIISMVIHPRWRKDSLILLSSVKSGSLFESRHQ